MKKKWILLSCCVLLSLVVGFLGLPRTIVVLLTISGRWDITLEISQIYLSSLPSEVFLSFEEKDLYESVLMLVALAHSKMKEHDKAIEMYENKVIPILKRGRESQRYYLYVTLNDVAISYISKGDYNKALDCLNEALTLTLYPGWTQHASSRGFLTELKIKEVTDLVAIVDKQERYLSTIVSAAKQYQFSNVSKVMDTNDFGCPMPPRWLQSPSPPLLVIAGSFAFILWLSFCFMRRDPPQNLVKRGFVMSVFAVPALILTLVGLCWNILGLFERLVSWAKGVASAGGFEQALELYDIARCEILTNPHHESILMTDIGIDIFVGAMWVYNERNQGILVDMLSATINELIDSNRVLGPSQVVATYYNFLSSVYLNRDEIALADSNAALAQGEWDELKYIMTLPNNAARETHIEAYANQQNQSQYHTSPNEL